MNTVPFTRRLALVAAAAVASVGVAAPVDAVAGDKRKPADGPVNMVVKVVDDPACSIEALAKKYDLRVNQWVLDSRRIYRLRPVETPASRASRAEAVRGLSRKVAKDHCTAYAEPDLAVTLNKSGFHSWAAAPATASTASNWSSQPVRSLLGLPKVHKRATGSGAVIAVLDTGVDERHPVLAGRLLPGYDFIDDDNLPGDVATGVDSDGDGVRDGAVGHGTFVAGTAALVAPNAQIMPLRVLDADGSGDAYVVAEAVYAAIEADVDVINLSFGTGQSVESKVVRNAIQMAVDSDIVVVAAAGNDASSVERFPAAAKGVLSVAALSGDGAGLAAYSNFGSWVRVAAPGTEVIGPLPAGAYGQWSGTSVAAPVVSGQAALLSGASDAVSAKAIVDIIEGTARKVKSAEVKKGRVDLAASVHTALKRAKKAKK